MCGELCEAFFDSLRRLDRAAFLLSWEKRLCIDPGAAAALHNPVGNNGSGGPQVGIFQIGDDLGCGLLAQLIGIDGNSGQLGRGQLAVEGIVEGDDGEISGDGQSGCGTGPFQNQSEGHR